MFLVLTTRKLLIPRNRQRLEGHHCQFHCTFIVRKYLSPWNPADRWQTASSSRYRHEGRQPLREDAIYRIASMSKPIIAVAMLLLCEGGKWPLDDFVTKFIPEFADLKVLKDGELVPLDRPMTMRHLMASSAGFAFGPGLGTTNPKVDDMYSKAGLWSGTNDDIIPKLAKLPLESQPGAEFRYGLQQEVQGAILRRISGEQLDTVLERRIFEPLGMKHGRSPVEKPPGQNTIVRN
jgi:CubicO group peptidase (beta-lactamase class C family)